MNTISNRGELRKRESLINSPNAVQLRTPQPISGAEQKPKGQIPIDQLGGATFRPKIQNHVINGPVKSDGKPWLTIHNKAEAEAAEVMIYDQIGKDWWSGEGVGAKEYREALDKLDPTKTRNLKVRINSPGGNVYDGLAIRSIHKEWKGRVDTYNDGFAASIASVILLSPANGGKVHASKESSTMIHRASTVAMGTVEDMQRAIHALEAAEKNILSVYTERTGKPEKELSDAMAKETWFTGPEAKDFGFVDELTEAAPVANSFDLSNFKRVPEAFRKLQNSAPKNGGHSSLMNRQQIIARLKKLGVTVDETSTDEQLIAQLDAAIDAYATATPPLAQTPAPAVPGASAPDAATTNRIAQLEAKYEAERKTRITNAVNACVGERRIVAAQAAFWIEQAMKDEAVLTNLQSLPQALGPEPIGIECVSESIHDIANYAKRLGGHVKNSARDPLALGSFIQKNRAKLIEVWNANTIDAALKQDVLFETGMRAFAKLMNNLSAFSTKFENVALRGTNIVTVPFFDLQTAASTDFVAANGYVAGNTAVSKKQVTVNKRKYQALQFTSDELRRQPFLGLQQNMILNAEKLAYDIQQDIFSVITAANFATTGYTGVASTFDSAIVANLQLSATTTGQWPFVGRSLWVSSAYDTNLKKDSALKLFFNSGTNDVLVDGKWKQKLYGFDYYEVPNLPTNGAENLTGFIAFQSALLLATAPIEPSEEVIRDGTQYSVMADANGGPALEMRKMGDSQKDTATWVIESNYGYAAGNGAALQRIKSA